MLARRASYTPIGEQGALRLLAAGQRVVAAGCSGLVKRTHDVFL